MLRTGLAAFMLITGISGAQAQENNSIIAAIERFVEECGSAMAAPAAYFEQARAQGEESPVAVAQAEGENIHWVIDMTPPGELSVLLGEVAGRTRIVCTLGLFNDDSVMNPALTNETVLDWLDTQDALQRAGGAVDLKALLAGDAGETGEAVELTAQVYQHLLEGWSDTGAIASVAIQVGMLEIDSSLVRPEPLHIGN